MSSRGKGRVVPHRQPKKDILFFVCGISLLTICLITMVSLGAVGRLLYFFVRLILGGWGFLLPMAGIIISLYVLMEKRWPHRWSQRWVGISVMVFSGLVLRHILDMRSMMMPIPNQDVFDHIWFSLLGDLEQGNRTRSEVGSGMVGAGSYALLYFLFDDTGAILTLLAAFICGLALVMGPPNYLNCSNYFRTLWQRIGDFPSHWMILRSLWRRVADFSFWRRVRQVNTGALDRGNRRPATPLRSGRMGGMKRSSHPARNRQNQNSPGGGVSSPTTLPVIHDFAAQKYQDQPDDGGRGENVTARHERSFPSLSPPVVNSLPSPPTVEYVMPSLSLLRRTNPPSECEKKEVEQEAVVLIDKLQSFGIHANVVSVHRGPSVTRYAIQPEAGIKVSRIASLGDDMALALAARSLRIEAPIPGESAIGIEVPNKKTSPVGLRELLDCRAFRESTSYLMIALGRDVSGSPIFADLAKMPHLLVAGTTGSGKSVCINVILVSLLYRARPDELRLVLIDPKMVELSTYNDIPHLLAPVVTDVKQASAALKQVVGEMERRYQLLKEAGVRDIYGYNEGIVSEHRAKGEGENPVEPQPLPWIVVVVDELADLMMVAPGEVEESIGRLAQKARAAGIHLILATQRPSANVITGIIKANIPTRIAFSVSSSVDSRIILDTTGAERLLGKGDSLYTPVGSRKPVRLQGALVQDGEVRGVVEHVKRQQTAEYEDALLPESLQTQVEEGEASTTVHPTDPLFENAVRMAIEVGSVSTSMLQRRLRVGFSRAGRLMDMLEEQGVVGSSEAGGKARPVRITWEDWERYHQGTMKSLS
ncbi:FtsK/SpoIIIE family DNA translocase [Pasteuria penetrans]|uniref:FtsK/SpoIIIE family DNA translocase n=1 Tax=Pasteuria penetrans TaxID=86005 RepID=UPI001FE8E64A|nr:DNA translocase FtsK [Pasteuria penetrans]